MATRRFYFPLFFTFHPVHFKSLYFILIWDIVEGGGGTKGDFKKHGVGNAGVKGYFSPALPSAYDCIDQKVLDG